MQTTLDLKPSHAPIKKYLEELESHDQMSITHELAVKQPFYALLHTCTRKMGERWNLIAEKRIRGTKGKDVCPDATVVGEGLVRGYWEAKDSDDEIKVEAKKKFDKGYPTDNILFQSPTELLLYQNNVAVFSGEGQDPEAITQALKLFFEYRKPEHSEWERAVEQFKEEVPHLADSLKEIIKKERTGNRKFIEAFEAFYELCRQAINPALSPDAVEGMLIQHLLTERIFRKVFNNPDFTRRNVIAAEIEKVIDVLTRRSFNREHFMAQLDYFYKAIESNAENAKDYSEKQTLLNTVYERFFQGWSPKEADTHGIVYTPQAIVDFMVRSVEEILQTEFGRSLSDEGVHILDPFVGTGNFMVRVMREIKPTKLRHKYEHELHCNEVMLMPYYIACMNLEHAYHEAMGEYRAFPGICLVDTFELAEAAQGSLFTAENTERVERQKRAPIFVVIGNPPYNAWQVNQNDNNKNRKYPILDRRVADTYTAKSTATNKSALSDMYVKAIRWASDRIGREGLVAFVSNNSFLDSVAFDGMRVHLENDFSRVYHVNLKGDARTSGERRRREAGNVFNDQIRVSIGISCFVRKADTRRPAEIEYYAVEDYWNASEKQQLLRDLGSFRSVHFKRVAAKGGRSWLDQDDANETRDWAPLGTDNQTVGAIFGDYSYGNDSGRDAWVYGFQRDIVAANSERFSDKYNSELERWHRSDKKMDLDKFLEADTRVIKWTRNAKRDLVRKKYAKYSEDALERSVYRPYQSVWHCAGRLFNKEVGGLLRYFPPQKDNLLICVSGVGSKNPFQSLVTGVPACADMLEKTQCFPSFVYDEDGTNRRENITDWALDRFRTHYADKKITKRDIFHYTYAVLHDPVYRERYAANLKRELPRIPYAPDFHAYAQAGKRLAEIHAEYEKQKPFQLKEITKEPFTWRVERMRLSRDKKTLTYNECLTLTDIPPEVYEYRLGNRSALEWVVEQYQVSTDKRSGIVNDPNREEDPEYIYNLIRKVVTVSLETVSIVKSLPGLGLPEAEKAASVQ